MLVQQIKPYHPTYRSYVYGLNTFDIPPAVCIHRRQTCERVD